MEWDQLPNGDGQLFPGMYAEIKFALPHDQRTLLIPGNAVMIRSDGPKVLVVDAKQTIRARAVKLGRDLGDKVEILSGVDLAEPIVANPNDALRDGVEVKVQQPTNPAEKESLERIKSYEQENESSADQQTRGRF